MEAHAHEVAKAPDALSTPRRAHALGGVLDHAQSVMPGDRVEPVAVHRQSGQIHGEESTGLSGDRGFDALEIDVAGCRIDVDEHGASARAYHDVRCRHPGERSRDDFVPRSDIGDCQRELERTGAGGERAHWAPAEEGRELGLELLHLRTARDPAGAQHLDHAGDGVLVDRGAREGQIGSRPSGAGLGWCAHQLRATT
jgi:hypothetical protein